MEVIDNNIIAHTYKMIDKIYVIIVISYQFKNW